MNVSRRITFLTVGLLLVLAITVGLSLYIITQPLGSGLAGAAGAAGGRETGLGYTYMLVCGGNIRATFQSMKGPGVSSEIVENRFTDNGKEGTRLIPGRLNFPALVLKRALSNDLKAWNWRKQVTDGQVNAARLNCSINVADSRLTVLEEWELINAWPSAYTVETDVETNAPIETLTIVYEALNRIK